MLILSENIVDILIENQVPTTFMCLHNRNINMLYINMYKQTLQLEDFQRGDT
jgi:hypothetical protein